MSYKYVKNSRKKLKERILYVMGEKCCICGYDKCPSALDLHHLNPDEKEFTICQNANRGWATVRKEIKKCILICSNCHRELHSGLINTDNLKSTFNEERAVEIDNLIEDLKTHKVYYCKFCGVEVYQGNDCCKKCSDLQRRMVERPSRKELKNLIRTTPFTQIGAKYGVSDNAIRKWCISENLPSKSTEIKKISDEEWEKI